MREEGKDEGKEGRSTYLCELLPAENVGNTRTALTPSPHDSPAADSCHRGTPSHWVIRRGGLVFVAAASVVAAVAISQVQINFLCHNFSLFPYVGVLYVLYVIVI